MKKLTNIIASSSLVTIMGLSLGIAFALSSNKVYTPTFATYTNGDAATYYNSIDSTQSGNTLLTALRTLNLNKRKSTVGYSSMGTDPSGQFKYTDYDPDYVQYDSNGQPYGTRISSFYTYTSATGWNREHVWPNSHGGGSGGDAGSPYPDADIHMPRPTISSENSSRGNSFFVEGMNHSSNGWDPKTAGYNEQSRGEAARITFYCTLVNSKLILAPNNTTPSGTDSVTGQSFGSGHTMGNLETLIKWNLNYPVTQREQNRNEGAEYLQGNRNPFVDHPEYACKIWGNVNSTIKSMCDASLSAPTSISLSPSSTTLAVNSTVTLSVSVSPSNSSSSVTWSTSNSSVATVSNGVVTAKAGGTATITATSTVDSSVKGTATITVKTVSSLSKTGTPTKTTYTSGESFDPSGLTITATYSDSSSSNVTSLVTWSPSPLTAGTTSVTGSYGGKSVTVSGLTVEQATDPVKISSNSDLSTGDYVYIRTDQSTPNGVTGNGSGNAAISTTKSSWKQYEVKNASSSGFKLYDAAASQYIATPTSNTFGYDTSGGTCSTDSEGHLICNSRYLCINGSYNRFYGSIGSYTPFFIYKIPSGSTKTLSSISVSTAPTKTTYTAGQTFDPTGLVIKRTYSDSTYDTYAYAGHTSEFTFSPSTSTALTTSNTSVTITYGGKSTTQSITVNAATKTLSSISISGYTTSFTVGDTFSFGGTVTATYSDSSTADVTNSATFSGYNMSTTGEQTVTVSYTYGSITKTATYSITVSSSGGSSSDSYYEKVTSTSNVTSGKYLIVYETGNLAFNGGLSTLDATSNYISVTISNSKISYSTTVAAAEFTITVGSSSSTIKSASGYYIGQGSNSNGLSTSTSSSAYTNSISISSDNVDIVSSGAYLRYNSASDQARFRYYKSSSYTGQKAIQLYKYVESSGSSETAATWGTTFLSTITCNGGTTAPSTSAWTTMKIKYESLSATEKANVTSATANESGTDLQRAIARYVFIVNKYTNRTNYPDYLNKASNSNKISILSNNSNNIVLLVVCSSVIVLFSAAVVWYQIRKRKEA